MSADPRIPQPTCRTSREAPTKPPGWFPWTSVLLVSGLFFGIYAFLETPREIGRWHLAAALEHWTEAEYTALKGDASRAAEYRERAFAKVEDALKWSPEEPDWILLRAQWQLRAGKKEKALADCNGLIERIGENPDRLSVRMEIHQQLGEHAKAVKDAERLSALSLTSGTPSRGEALNTIAYVKAVGKIDLPGALADAEESVADAAQVAQREPSNDEAKWALALRQDTRGFVHYQLGHFPQALRDLQAAGDEMEVILREHASRRSWPDARVVDLSIAARKHPTAVVIYHRALVNEKLGHAAAAATDRKKVKALIGRDGDEKLF